MVEISSQEIFDWEMKMLWLRFGGNFYNYDLPKVKNQRSHLNGHIVFLHQEDSLIYQFTVDIKRMQNNNLCWCSIWLPDFIPKSCTLEMKWKTTVQQQKTRKNYHKITWPGLSFNIEYSFSSILPFLCRCRINRIQYIKQKTKQHGK